MARRSRAREIVLQALYLSDLNPQGAAEKVRPFLQRRLRDPELIAFAEALYDGCVAHKQEIDQRLSGLSENWKVERMPAVDRNILRLGAYELLWEHTTPSKVILDESIELAKRYGSAESSAFVNAILDRLALARPTPPAAESLNE
jgi:N utilization substance protein B